MTGAFGGSPWATGSWAGSLPAAPAVELPLGSPLPLLLVRRRRGRVQAPDVVRLGTPLPLYLAQWRRRRLAIVVPDGPLGSPLPLFLAARRRRRALTPLVSGSVTLTLRLSAAAVGIVNPLVLATPRVVVRVEAIGLPLLPVSATVTLALRMGTAASGLVDPFTMAAAPVVLRAAATGTVTGLVVDTVVAARAVVKAAASAGVTAPNPLVAARAPLILMAAASGVTRRTVQATGVVVVRARATTPNDSPPAPIYVPVRVRPRLTSTFLLPVSSG